MSDTTVNPVSGSGYFGATAVKAKSGLDMSTFLNLLVTQLQNQDPTSPMDDASFYGQIAQLGQVQGLQQLNTSADLAQAQNLLGKTVTATRPTSSASASSSTFTGVVQSITFKDGAYYLNVNEGGDGGTVQIQQSAIQSVLPTVDVAGMSSLIGKTVAGTTTTDGVTSDVVGTVVGITAQDGQAYAQVQSTSGGKTTTTAVPVSTLTQIATPSSP